jgi:hypothetical protein
MPTQRKLVKLMAGVQQFYGPGETMQTAIGGAYEGKLGNTDMVRDCVLVATESRVIFYAARLGGYDHETFPYSGISSVDAGKTMMGHKVTLYASGNTVNIKWVNDPGLSQFLNFVNEKLLCKSLPAPSVPSMQTTVVVDELDQLKRLGELRDAGVLTEDEFQMKKQQILSGASSAEVVGHQAMPSNVSPLQTRTDGPPPPGAVLHEGCWWTKGSDGSDYWWDVTQDSWVLWANESTAT